MDEPQVGDEIRIEGHVVATSRIMCTDAAGVEYRMLMADVQFHDTGATVQVGVCQSLTAAHALRDDLAKLIADLEGIADRELRAMTSEEWDG